MLGHDEYVDKPSVYVKQLVYHLRMFRFVFFYYNGLGVRTYSNLVFQILYP